MDELRQIFEQLMTKLEEIPKLKEEITKLSTKISSLTEENKQVEEENQSYVNQLVDYNQLVKNLKKDLKEEGIIVDVFLDEETNQHKAAIHILTDKEREKGREEAQKKKAENYQNQNSIRIQKLIEVVEHSIANNNPAIVEPFKTDPNKYRVRMTYIASLNEFKGADRQYYLKMTKYLKDNINKISSNYPRVINWLKQSEQWTDYVASPTTLQNQLSVNRKLQRFE